MWVSLWPKSLQGRGENDAIVTKEEPRFLWSHLRSWTQGYAIMKTLAFNVLEKAAIEWEIVCSSITTRHRPRHCASGTPAWVRLFPPWFDYIRRGNGQIPVSRFQAVQVWDRDGSSWPVACRSITEVWGQFTASAPTTTWQQGLLWSSLLIGRCEESEE